MNFTQIRANSVLDWDLSMEILANSVLNVTGISAFKKKRLGLFKNMFVTVALSSLGLKYCRNRKEMK